MMYLLNEGELQKLKKAENPDDLKMVKADILLSIQEAVGVYTRDYGWTRNEDTKRRVDLLIKMRDTIKESKGRIVLE